MKFPRFLQYLPVPVLRGPARGAWWTLAPYSGNWRHGGHERDVEESIRTIALPAGATAWDFGAHFGIHTVGLARHVGPAGQVAAFEPDADSFARCALHVRLNRLSQVVLIDRAVSDRDGEAVLVQSEGAGATTSHLAYDGETPEERETHARIRTASPDALVRSGVLRPPQFIKVDVEGHAGQALRGSLEAIRTTWPALLVSFHSPQEIARVAGHLRPLGYEPSTATGAPAAWADCRCGGTLLFRRP